MRVFAEHLFRKTAPFPGRAARERRSFVNASSVVIDEKFVKAISIWVAQSTVASPSIYPNNPIPGVGDTT
jgi:hypothetical protein